jgi:plasmid stabilization system protein ParE
VKVVLAPDAADDLAAVIEYLNQRNPWAATATADSIFRVIDRLAAREFEGPRVPAPEHKEARTKLAGAAVSHLLPPRRRYADRATDLPLVSTADSALIPGAVDRLFRRPERFR